MTGKELLDSWKRDSEYLAKLRIDLADQPGGEQAGVTTLHLQSHGAGRPLVVLPSFSLDHNAMASALEPVFIGRAGWRRLYVDLPGTGASPSGEPRSDAVLDAVLGTIEAKLDDERFAILGWSYGGYLAAGVTRRLPEQVCGLMMVCTGFRIRPQDRDLTGTRASTPEPKWLDEVLPSLHDHFIHAVGSQTAEVATRIAGTLGRNGPTAEDYLSALRRDGFALSDETALTPCDAPVCLLAGQRDRVVGFASLFDALGNYGHATYTCLSSAGHYLPLEQPAIFASVTQSWLTECESFLHVGPS